MEVRNGGMDGSRFARDMNALRTRDVVDGWHDGSGFDMSCAATSIWRTLLD